MAIIDNRGRIHGKIGNMVYRTVGTNNIVQTRPARVKQTLSTKESAMEFGLASNCGKILREVYSSFTCNSDGRMINRLNTILLKCIKDSKKERGERDLHDGNPDYLSGFQFNANSALDQALAVRPTCFLTSGKIRIRLPELKENSQLQQLRYGRNCVLRMMLVSVNFRENYYEYLSYKDIAIDRGAIIEEQDWQPEVILPPGSIVLASVSLHYYGLKDIAGDAPSINSKEFSPAEIIGAYHIEKQEESTQESIDETENNRQPLTNYFGKDILNEIARKRLKDKDYQKALKMKEKLDILVKKDTDTEIPKGKVFYRQ